MYKDEPKPPKGGGKKKGAAESVKQQRKDLVDDIPVDEVAGAGKGKKHPKKNHKKVVARKKGGAKKDVMMDENMSGGGRKKGSAKHIDGKEHTAKELKAEGKKLKKDARDKKKADKKASRATKKSKRKSNRSKKLQDKIDLQEFKGKQKLADGDKLGSKAKQDRIAKLKARKLKADGDVDKKGVAQYMKEGATDHKEGHKGGGKKKGAGDYDVKQGSHDHPHSGPGKMGFTQNFGPARQNSYARGAAKVAQIMGKGAFKKKGAADHEVGKPSHPKPNLSLNTSIKPSSPIPDYSSFSSMNQKVPKAPSLTGNSYEGHSSVSDIVNTQSSTRDFSNPSAMNLKDNNISRNSQFHYDTGNTGRLTPEISASYDKFLGDNKYMSSRDLNSKKGVNLNNPISKSNKKALKAFAEGRIYNQGYGV